MQQNSARSIIFIGFIFMFMHICGNSAFAAFTWTGDDNWKVMLLAGPGKGDEIMTSVAVSDWSTAGNNKVYGTGTKYDPSSPGMIPSSQRFIYEFSWIDTDQKWDKVAAGMPDASIFAIPRHIIFDNVRGDKTRLYFSSFNGCIYEYSYDISENKWIEGMSIPLVLDAVEIHGFSVNTRKVNGNKYLYRSGLDGNQLEEFKWDGASWEKTTEIGIIRTMGIYGMHWPLVTSISFGNKHKGESDDKNYMYINFFDTAKIHELAFDGTSWVISSVLPVTSSYYGGRPILFVADAGRGCRLYTLEGSSRIVELEFKNNRWIKRTIVELGVTKNLCAINYGKISSDPSDPIAIYALVGTEINDIGDDYQVNVNDLRHAYEIHEYTYTRTAEDPVKKWRQTLVVQLYKNGMSDFGRNGFGLADLCMVKGRNDQFERLYIVDPFGNLWECSIPPRKQRPDYTEIPSSSSDSEEDEPDKKPPSIMGGN